MEMIETDMNETLITLTSDIVAAHVSNNSVSVDDLATLISNVYGALSGLGQPAPVVEEVPEPAVSVRSSIKPDYIVCLEDGKKLKMLKRHLMTHYAYDARPVSARVEPAGRLSDGRAELCRTAPRTREEDRPRPKRRAHAGAAVPRRPDNVAEWPARVYSAWTRAGFRRVASRPDVRKIDLEALCAEKGLRITEQRRVIARVLSEAEDHPDVEELHARASAIDPGISIATVYRTVRLFEEAGILERHDFGDGRSRYEAAPEDASRSSDRRRERQA